MSFCFRMDSGFRRNDGNPGIAGFFNRPSTGEWIWYSPRRGRFCLESHAGCIHGAEEGASIPADEEGRTLLLHGCLPGLRSERLPRAPGALGLLRRPGSAPGNSTRRPNTRVISSSPRVAAAGGVSKGVSTESGLTPASGSVGSLDTAPLDLLGMRSFCFHRRPQAPGV